MQDEAGRSDATNSLRVSTITSMVTAFLSNNHVPQNEVPALISMFTSEVDTLINGTSAPAAPEPEAPRVPFVSARKSITPDYLISLFDGRQFRSLKRYLSTTHNMTPDEYRAYWSLPKDYPMVAPNYSAQRSELAKSMGLGQGGRQPAKDSSTKAPKAPKATAAKNAPKATGSKRGPKPKTAPAADAPTADASAEA